MTRTLIDTSLVRYPRHRLLHGGFIRGLIKRKVASTVRDKMRRRAAKLGNNDNELYRILGWQLAAAGDTANRVVRGSGLRDQLKSLLAHNVPHISRTIENALLPRIADRQVKAAVRDQWRALSRYGQARLLGIERNLRQGERLETAHWGASA